MAFNGAAREAAAAAAACVAAAAAGALAGAVVGSVDLVPRAWAIVTTTSRENQLQWPCHHIPPRRPPGGQAKSRQLYILTVSRLGKLNSVELFSFRFCPIYLQ